jgi:signal transduction histidine kinase
VEEKKAEIKVDPLPLVNVVRFQFLQLFMNLLSNAIKYQQPGTPPVIKISSALIPNSEMGFNAVFPSKNYLRISVSDNGIGFEEEYSDKIFDLFTRLHGREQYTGTGVGLATCKKIVHNHQGFIKAESRVGIGSTFFIYLPEETMVGPYRTHPAPSS